MHLSLICLFMLAENEVKYYSNFNLNDIVTPINLSRLKYWLNEAGYDEGKAQELIEGFEHGFDLGYRGTEV